MMIETMLIGVIFLILGFWFIYDRKQKKGVMEQMVAHASLNARVQSAESQMAELKQALTTKDVSINALNREISDYKSNITELETRLSEERKAAVEKLALLEEAKEKLGNEFKLLANQIFEEKGKALNEQNRNSLDEVLKPMREQLGDFRKRVDEVHLNDSKDRASLREHLGQLEKLNRQMSEDALGLTQALKGESKAHERRKQGAGQLGRDDIGADSGNLRLARGA